MLSKEKLCFFKFFNQCWECYILYKIDEHTSKYLATSYVKFQLFDGKLVIITWCSFNDGHGLQNLFLVGLGARSVHLSHNMGHTGLVSHESGHVDRLARVILWEG